MYIVNNYTLAVIFCVVTMICWGSWGNTQKLAAKAWFNDITVIHKRLIFGNFYFISHIY